MRERASEKQHTDRVCCEDKQLKYLCSQVISSDRESAEQRDREKEKSEVMQRLYAKQMYVRPHDKAREVKSVEE